MTGKTGLALKKAGPVWFWGLAGAGRIVRFRALNLLIFGVLGRYYAKY
jgi:hypothetical protein